MDPPQDGKRIGRDQDHEEKGENGSGSGKGKEKSALDRLRSSGQMVVNSLTGGASELANLPGASEKSTQFGSSSTSGLSSAAQTEPASSRQQRGTGANLGEGSFKSQPAPSSSSASFNDFLGTQPTLPPGEQQHGRHFGDKTQDSGAAESQDGAAVVGLLSQPLDLEELHSLETEYEAMNATDARNLHNALFNNGPGTTLPWDHLLNFTPDFVSDPSGNRETAQAHLGTSDPQSARATWLSQWHDVLSAYSDEVWGDLEPLATQAKKEVEALETTGNDSSMPEPGKGSLKRLQMILAHVRGSM